MAKTTDDPREQEFASAVRNMFSGIADRYDLLNHVLSLNIDKRWRRKLKKRIEGILALPEARVLDVACGTGDVAIELDRGSQATIIGTDFCRPMLEIAKRKSGDDIDYIEADAMALGFADAHFDGVTIAFGLRNVANKTTALQEFFRILRPGGTLAILEFSKPRVPGLAALFDLYFTKVLPRIGGTVSGSRSAYEYLPDSVGKFPDQAGLAEMIRSVGFEQVSYTDLSGGIAAIHIGIKPSAL
ncbi:MAG: bifunctional demethylmenaquinone methyltransferase/2-methoxy-6-polyprenyl-1,4-benzoquinol methylase UbiE [Acidobacteriota bacterium]|nr:MAG: bifunctional demethylmenaquinone methyltransferase/2-methoxy-6-polyprenyl-1,4-benzoquinol methylase UbiE [Acidobacteriota bacterium]